MIIDNPIYIEAVSSGTYHLVRSIFVALGAGMFVAIVWLLKNSTWLSFRYLQDINEITRYKAYGLKKITKDWLKIVGRLERGMESEYKLAVIEADNMLNETFNRIGYSGQTLGDKLKILTPDTCPNIDEVREAHQMRNSIVHDPDYQLSLPEAKKVTGIYEKVFRDFEML
ncbi:MAG: hypothetical protein ABIF89_02225 [bacterium]